MLAAPCKIDKNVSFSDHPMIRPSSNPPVTALHYPERRVLKRHRNHGLDPVRDRAVLESFVRSAETEMAAAVAMNFSYAELVLEDPGEYSESIDEELKDRIRCIKPQVDDVVRWLEPIASHLPEISRRLDAVANELARLARSDFEVVDPIPVDTEALFRSAKDADTSWAFNNAWGDT